MLSHVIPQCLVRDRITIKLQLTGKSRLIFKFLLFSFLNQLAVKLKKLIVILLRFTSKLFIAYYMTFVAYCKTSPLKRKNLRLKTPSKYFSCIIIIEIIITIIIIIIIMGICSGISTEWLFIHCFQIELHVG